MTARVAAPPAPGPLETYAAQFDDLFGRLAQRSAFREYLQGLLLPRDRNKTLTARLLGIDPRTVSRKLERQEDGPGDDPPAGAEPA